MRRRRSSPRSRRYGSSDAVDLDGVHVRDALGEVARQHAEARADLEHDVVGRELGEAADHAEDVLVDEEVLAELLLRRDFMRSPKHSVALRSICRSSSRRLLARAPARARRACARRTPARSRCPRTGCGARYGASVSARIRSAGTCVAASRRSTRLRERHVAGERDVPAALERRLEQVRRREAVEDDAAVEAGERGERVGVGGARVDDDGLPQSRRRRRAARRTERAARRAARSRGTSRARSPPPRPPSDARAARAPRRRRRRSRAGLVRVDAEDREDAVVRSASSSARRQPATSVPTVRMRVTPASRARATTSAGSSSSASRCACVSITLLEPSRASSSAAVSGGSLRKSGRGSRSCLAGGELARRPRRRPSSRSRR